MTKQFRFLSFLVFSCLLAFAGTQQANAQTMTTFASGFGYPAGLAFDASGNLYVVENGNQKISKVNSAGSVSTFVGGLFDPRSVVFDNVGNLIVADNNNILKVTSAGNVSTLATFPNQVIGSAVDATGNVYTMTGNLLDELIKITSSGDVSTFATNIGQGAKDVISDKQGGFYASDYATIYHIDQTGTVTTVASGLEGVLGLALDASGNVYFVRSIFNFDDFSYQFFISKVSSAGVVSDVVNTGLDRPYGLAFDASGNLYVGNTGDGTIKKITLAAPTPTIASFSPVKKACPGATITITGTNLTGATAVTIGGVAVSSFKVIDANTIIAVAGTTVTGTIAVTTASGSATSTDALVVAKQVSTLSLVASSTSFCAGTSVTFTATASDAGSAPFYLWKKNGKNVVGWAKNTYSDNALNNGDVITCVLTSNSSCVINNSATSNAISVSVSNKSASSVSIAATATSVCFGSKVTITATPTNGGSAPFYLWKRNGVNFAGGTSNSLNFWDLKDGEIVTVQLTSNASCVVSPVLSNAITFVVGGRTTPTVAISASATTIQQGTKVTFKVASSTNAGAAPVYVWRKNGVNIKGGLNDTIYSSDATLKNGDVISVGLASSATCVVTPVYSNNIVLTVTPKAPTFTQASGIANAEARGINAATIAASVYPNPSNGSFKLSAQLSNSSETQAATVQIMNAYGEVVAVYNTTAINGAINLQVNAGSLGNGLYLVKYTAGNESGTTKLVVSK